MPDTNLSTLEDWIADEAISFSIDDVATLNAAAERLMAACDPSLEILGLGEPTHLVNDYLRLRNRLFQTLVERHGFTAIAIESSFSRGAIVNDYVAGRGDSLEDALDRGITHRMGGMPANRELLEWMRQYNAEASLSKQLRFYGFDSPTEMTHADSPRQLLSVALDYLAMLNSTSGAMRRAQIDPLIGNDADWENQAAMMDPTKSIGRSPAADALRLATEDLIAELAMLRPQGMATDAHAYRQAMRCAVHARQMLTYHAAVAQASANRIADLLGLRDAMMADNLRYAAEQERGRGKLFAFAHNSHLKRGQAVWDWGPSRFAWWPAGAHLSATMGSKYAVIGVGAGTSRASKLGAPEAGTLEARLLAAPGPVRMIPTHLGKSLEAAELPTRSTGGNPGYFPFDRASLSDFDFLAVINDAE
jgi:erythromycin esterase-like protein